MVIRALKDYWDVELKKDIFKNEEYEVEHNRGAYIVSNGYAEVVSDETEEKKEDEKTVIEEPVKVPSEKRGRKKNAVSKAANR